MAYIEWWNRTGPATLGERFGLNEISTARKTLSPTKSYASIGTNPTFAPEEIEVPNWRDLIREEGVEVGPQVNKDGGRIDMKPGGIVEPGIVNYGKKVTLTSQMKKNIAEFEEINGKGAYEKAENWQKKDVRDGNWKGTGSGGTNIRPTEEIIELVKRTKGGDLKIKEWRSNPTEENFQKLRETAKQRATYENQMYTTKAKYLAYREKARIREKRQEATDKGKEYLAKRQATTGMWPAVDSKERVWRDIRRASLKEGSRFKLLTNVPKAVVSEKGIKYVPWQKVYKNAVFYDTKTKQKITFDGLEKYMNKHIGKKTYKNAIANYDTKKLLESIEMIYKGKKTTVGDLLRRNIISEKEMKANKGFSAIEVNHKGTPDEFWNTEVSARTANRKLVPLKSRYTKLLELAGSEADKAKVIKEFTREIEKVGGGIRTIFAGKERGIVPTATSILETLGKQAHIKGKNWTKVLQQIKNIPKGPGRLRIISTLIKAGVGVHVLNKYGISSAEAAEAQTLEPSDKTQEAGVGASLGEYLLGGAGIGVGTAISNYPKQAWELAKKAGKYGIVKPLAGVTMPGIQGLWEIGKSIKEKRLPNLPDVTDPHTWMNAAFWNWAVKEWGMDKTAKNFGESLKTLSTGDKARAFRNVVARAGLSPKAVRFISSRVAWPAAAAASVYDSYKDYQERKEFLTPERIAEAQKEEFDKEEPMFAQGGIASLMK